MREWKQLKISQVGLASPSPLRVWTHTYSADMAPSFRETEACIPEVADKQRRNEDFYANVSDDVALG